jgi:Calpain family cysteine protease.
VNRELKDLERYMGSSSFQSNTFHMGKHFYGSKCKRPKDLTEEEKAWLADPNALPKNVEGFTKWSAKRVTLYPFGKPMPADCNQHAIGDCNTISTLADMAYLYPRFIQSIIRQDGTMKFYVKMFDPDGNRIEVAVNNKILCDNNGNVAQVTGKKGAITWATILEKAIAKWLYVYKPDTGLGGFGAEGMTPMFTGDGRSFSVSPGSVSATNLARFVTVCLKHGLIVNGGFNKGNLPLDKHETITAHGHSFLLPNDPDALFAIRNPWGQGSDDHVMQCKDDGVVPPTIDLRIISPGIAALYFDTPLEPYVHPKW